jgi:DNA-binding NtrC family response regulator
MKKHILLIDDDKDELTIFMAALRKVPHDDGFKCTYASDAAQAIEMLKYLVPDCIFTDFNISGMNGLDVLSYVKSQQQLEKTRLCLYSNLIDEKTKSRADAMGAYCLQKPDTIDKLANSLSIFFDRRSEPDYSLPDY